MRSEYIAELLSQPIRPLGADLEVSAEALTLEVNVIHTDPQGTAAALEFATRMAHSLGACVRVRAAVSVPLQLPMDQSLISVQFMESLLCDLALKFGEGVDKKTVQVHLCRDRIEVLLRVLRPHSLVVVAGRKHWWPTPANRLAQSLRNNGHDVVFVRVERPITVEVMGESMIQTGPDSSLSQSSLENLLRAIHIKLRSRELSQTPSFSLDASITLASFLTASSISMRIQEAEPVLKPMNGVR